MTNKRAIKAKALVWASVAGVGCFLVVTAIAGWYQFTNVWDQTGRDLLITARALSYSATQYFTEVRRFTLGLGVSLEQDLLTGEFRAAYEKALRAEKTTQLPDHVVVYDESGQQVLNTLVAYGTPLPVTRNVDRVKEVFRTGQPRTSNLVVGTISRNFEIFVDVPVLREGRVAYVLTTVLNVRQLRADLLAQEFPPDWTINVFDGDAKVVARSRDHDKFVGKRVSERFQAELQRHASGVFENVNLDGATTLAAFVRDPGTGYGVIIGVPKRRLLAEAASYLPATILTTALGVIALMTAWSLAYRLRQRRERESLLGQFVREAPVALAMFDGAGQLMAASRRWSDDLHGEPAGATTPDRGEALTKLPARWNEGFARALEGKATRSDEDRIGNCGWLRWEVQPWRQAGGEVVGAIVFSEDITRQVEARNALRESERRLQLAQVSAKAGTWEWELVTNRNSWTDEVFRLYGLEPGCGEPSYAMWLDTIVPADRPAIERTVAEAARLGTAFEIEWRVARSDPVRWLLARGQPQSDDDGKLARFLGIVLDITERKQSEAELEAHRLRLEELIHDRTAALEQANAELARRAAEVEDLYDRAPCGYHSLAPDGTILMVNDRELEMLGYTRSEFVGRNIIEFHTPASAARFRERYSGFLHAGRARDLDFEFVRKDGSPLPVLVSAELVRDASGTPVYSRSTVVDDTERRAHESQLVAMADELARRSEAADAANRAKSIFLAAMSHEIRTPLNGILGMAYLVRRGGVTTKQAEQLDKVADAGRHLLAIINDVLDISKIEAGKIVLEDSEFTRADLEAGMASLVGDTARAKGLQLEFDLAALPAVLRGDRTRLQQALLNYLGNAVKFTEHGSVTLRASVVAATEADRLVRFEVTDTGIGIPAAALGHLFVPFEQVETGASRRYGGTGLGLAITRRLAALMGGEVGVESIEGSGSTFWMTARIARAIAPPQNANADTAPKARLQQNHAGRRVLVVEDDALNAEVLRDILHGIGLRVETATNGSDAVELAGHNDYPAILMDVEMPGMNGLETTRAIRALPGRAHTPILAVTASVYDENRRACVAAGMDDFVAKPIDPDLLFAALLRQLTRDGSRR